MSNAACGYTISSNCWLCEYHIPRKAPYNCGVRELNPRRKSKHETYELINGGPQLILLQNQMNSSLRHSARTRISANCNDLRVRPKRPQTRNESSLNEIMNHASFSESKKIFTEHLVRVPTAFVPWKSYLSVGCSSSSTAATVKAVGARRALAIRRVVEDRDQSTVREYSLIGTKRGDTIFTQSWTPFSVKIR